MRNWFRRQPVGVDAPGRLESYREGRIDEKRHLEREGLAVVPDQAAIDAAYKRGLRERRVRRASPVITLLVLLAVVVAGGFVYLAVRNGSFSSGGAVVDRSLDNAAHSVKAPLRNAADKTGDALEQAGRDLKQ